MVTGEVDQGCRGAGGKHGGGGLPEGAVGLQLLAFRGMPGEVSFQQGCCRGSMRVLEGMTR